MGIIKYDELLKKYIKDSALTLDELSDQLQQKGLSATKQYLSRLQNGKNPPASDELNLAIADITHGNPDKLLWYAYIEKGPKIAQKIAEFIDEESLSHFTKVQSEMKEGLLSKEEFINKSEYINFKASISEALKKASKQGIIKKAIEKDKELQKLLDGEIPLTDNLTNKIKYTLIRYLERINVNSIETPIILDQFQDVLLESTRGLFEEDYDGNVIDYIIGIIDDLNKEFLLHLLVLSERFILSNNLNNPSRIYVSDSETKPKQWYKYHFDKEKKPLYLLFLNDAKKAISLSSSKLPDNILKKTVLQAINALELLVNTILIQSIRKNNTCIDIGPDYFKDLPINSKLNLLRKYINYDIFTESFYMDLYSCITLSTKIGYGDESLKITLKKAKEVLAVYELAINSIKQHAKANGIEAI